VSATWYEHEDHLVHIGVVSLPVGQRMGIGTFAP
jgi:hypothetical protein